MNSYFINIILKELWKRLMILLSAERNIGSYTVMVCMDGLVFNGEKSEVSHILWHSL